MPRLQSYSKDELLIASDSYTRRNRRKPAALHMYNLDMYNLALESDPRLPETAERMRNLANVPYLEANECQG